MQNSVVGFVNGFEGTADFDVSGRLAVVVSSAETFNGLVLAIAIGRANINTKYSAN